MMLGLGLGLWPQARDLAPSWVLPSASVHRDFRGDRYFRRDVGVVPRASLAPLVRALAATHTGPDGGMATAAVDALRLDYDPVTLAPLGALLEGAETNLFVRSGEPEDAAWTKTNLSISTGAGIGPDGVAGSARKVVESSGASAQHTSNNVTVITKAAADLDFSGYLLVKAAGRARIRAILVDSSNGSNALQANVDLAADPLAPEAHLTGANVTFANPRLVAKSLHAGWYQIGGGALVGAATTGLRWRLQMLDADGNSTYAGDGASGFLVGGAQLVQRSFASSYIPTAGAAVTRPADDLTLPLGPWFNAARWTIAFDGAPEETYADQILEQLYLDADNRAALRRTAAGHLQALYVVGGVTTTVDLGAHVGGAAVKVAMTSDGRGIMTGGAVVGAAVGTPSGLTTWHAGHGADLAEHAQVRLGSDAIFPFAAGDGLLGRLVA